VGNAHPFILQSKLSENRTVNAMQVKAIKRGNTIELLEELNLPEDREIVLDICAIATDEPLETRSPATFGSAKGQPLRGIKN